MIASYLDKGSEVNPKIGTGDSDKASSDPRVDTLPQETSSNQYQENSDHVFGLPFFKHFTGKPPLKKSR